jgi:hypothetical protein
MLVKIFLIILINWLLCFGVKVETRFISFYLNGLFATYEFSGGGE